VTSATERRCKATSRSGNACRAKVVNAAGYCVAHDPEKPMDMRALGRKSGEARRRPNPERVHQNLREYLRQNVEPAEVWAALKLAMEGENESARVSASRVLMDALAEPERDGDEQRKADFARAGAEARQYLAKQLDRRARVMKAADVRQVRDVLDEVAAEMRAAAADLHPDLVAGDISVEDAERIFEGLEEIGLIVRRHRLEELVEERARERLTALKAEHGIPHP
jgi:hypothetical protein